MLEHFKILTQSHTDTLLRILGEDEQHTWVLQRDDYSSTLLHIYIYLLNSIQSDAEHEVRLTSNTTITRESLIPSGWSIQITWWSTDNSIIHVVDVLSNYNPKSTCLYIKRKGSPTYANCCTIHLEGGSRPNYIGVHLLIYWKDISCALLITYMSFV